MLKLFLRNSIEKTFQYQPLAILNVLTGKSSVFPYYHLVSDNTPWYFDNAYPVKSKKAFEKNLDLLLRYWKPIGLTELIAEITKSGKLPQGYFHISFDDGFSEVYNMAYPILKRKGIPATTFVCSDLIDNKNLHWEHKREIIIKKASEAPDKKKNEIALLFHNEASVMKNLNNLDFNNAIDYNKCAKILEIDFNDILETYKPYLSTLQINEMINNGFTIGAHSINHPRFQEITFEEQQKQIISSVGYITEKFKLPYRVFAFPYGEHDLPKVLHEFISQNDIVDLCFGTRGIISDEYTLIIQRLSMEAACNSKKLIKIELSKKMIRLMVNNDLVKRKV
jgi:peptidoglycan/xylan/chitin deacetylase (PgdA/CDA1 family)